MQRMAHPDGEVATARAAGRQDTLMTLSSWSTTSVEDVAAAGTGPKWFQLYVYKDRSVSTLNSFDRNGDSWPTHAATDAFCSRQGRRRMCSAGVS